mmetsp:Transcript_16171/g.41129  ORF Transcript_16171/g.41129 Transcript_16171/m.41129 type:complete len:246 (+) Transcript_16171:451-1188(+)
MPRLMSGSRRPTAVSAAWCSFCRSLPWSTHMPRVVTRTRARRRCSPAANSLSPAPSAVAWTAGRMRSSAATTMPSTDSMVRSNIAISSAVPVPLLPSLKRVMSWASPMRCMLPEETSRPLRRSWTPSIWPLRMTSVYWMPLSCASSACAHRKAYSPCTGRKCCGLISFSTSSSSSRYAWPEVCSSSPRPMAILGPRCAMLFIIFITRVSLPGITLALYTSRSESFSFRLWLRSTDAMLSADLGSP